MTTIVYYAWKPDGFLFINIYRSRTQVGMCGAKPEQIVKVTVKESDEGEHWGWFDNDTGSYSMIYPSRTQVEMCFTYGYAIEEERGRGRLVQLKVEAPIVNAYIML